MVLGENREKNTDQFIVFSSNLNLTCKEKIKKESLDNDIILHFL